MSCNSRWVSSSVFFFISLWYYDYVLIGVMVFVVFLQKIFVILWFSFLDSSIHSVYLSILESHAMKIPICYLCSKFHRLLHTKKQLEKAYYLKKLPNTQMLITNTSIPIYVCMKNRMRRIYFFLSLLINKKKFHMQTTDCTLFGYAEVHAWVMFYS